MRFRLDVERVRLLLEEKNITQRKMASYLNISPTTLNGYLRKPDRYMDYEMVEAIAHYLDVSVAYLTDQSNLRCCQATPETHGEINLIDTYRNLNADNKKIMETFSIQLLNSQQSEA